jgi:murein tripeptide amidase MpaA
LVFHDHKPKDDYEVGRVETWCLSTHYKDLYKQEQKIWSHDMINASREAERVEK